MNQQVAQTLIDTTHQTPAKFVGRFRSWYAFVPSTSDLMTLADDPHYILVGGKGQIREHHAPQFADEAISSSNYGVIEEQIGFYKNILADK